LDDISRKEVAIAKALPLVEEIAACLERGDYKQTVVFAWHRDAIRAVVDGLEARGIKTDPLVGGMGESTRTTIMEGFRAQRLQVVVCQIIAAGTAIDLSAASHGYFLELDWLPASNIQAANRLVSLQKDEPVTFDVCTWPGSVDDKVQRILLRRTQETRTILQ
jgi:superfamily II DNA/RNA helicase